MQERFWNTGCKDVRFSEYGTAVNLPRASHPQKLCVRVRWALMRERSLEGATCCHGWACILNQRPHINFPYNVDVAASCYGGASLQQALECFRTTFMFESEEVWSWMCSRTTMTWAVSHLWVGKNRSVQTHKADSPLSPLPTDCRRQYINYDMKGVNLKIILLYFLEIRFYFET